MSHITLLGSEDVARAGSAMSLAASGMRAAANNLDDALERHRRWMDDWLLRFQAVVESIPAPKDHP